MRKIILTAWKISIIFLAMFFFPFTTRGEDFSFSGERKITDFGYQQKAVIYRNYVVWQDRKNGNYDIYLYDLEKQEAKQITWDSSNQTNPDISGQYIVWQDFRNGNNDIYLYDISDGTEKRITSDPGSQLNPSIDGNYIVWEDYRNGTSNIYLYDIQEETEKQITFDPAYQKFPDISGHFIVWLDFRNMFNTDIYLYDIQNEENMQITTHTSYQGKPAISGDKIVYCDYRHKTKQSPDNAEIYLYDLSTRRETRITKDFNWNQKNPAIDGNYIVWEDYRNDPAAKIYLHDLSTGKTMRITNNFNYNLYPAVSDPGKRIVWQQIRGNQSNIYEFKIPTPPPSPVDRLSEKVQNLLGRKEIMDQEVKDSVLWILEGIRKADKSGDYQSAINGINTLLTFIEIQKLDNIISETAANELINIAKETIDILKRDFVK